MMMFSTDSNKQDDDGGPDATLAMDDEDEALRDAELAGADQKIPNRRRTQKVKSKGDSNFFKDVRKQSDYNAK